MGEKRTYKTAPRRKKHWTQEENDWLCEHWGETTIEGLCRHLQRSEKAILQRVSFLGLPPYLESGSYITIGTLTRTLGYHKQSGPGVADRWAKNRGFPLRYKRVGKKKVRIVYLEAFWDWAEKNRSALDFSKLEPLALGEEPDWVAEQRKKDDTDMALKRRNAWTPEEESRLIMLVKQHRYTSAELSAMLHRTDGAIKLRCRMLGLKDRPVEAESHGASALWTETDYATLAEGLRSGESYTAIGRTIGRPGRAVQDKVYAVYRTGKIDVARAMLGDGPWGTGAPVRDENGGTGYAKL